MSNGSFGDRMNSYENVSRAYLMRRVPTIIRMNINSSQSFTKDFMQPFNYLFNDCMVKTAKQLFENIQGCKLAYTQSDEINLLLTDYDRLNTQAWCGKNIQKMASVSASMATLYFNRVFEERTRELDIDVYKNKINTAMFDSTIFTLPIEEVHNYFSWRQTKAIENSKLALGRTHFLHNELYGLSINKIVEKLMTEKDVNWNHLNTWCKYGTLISEKSDPNETPLFIQDKEFIRYYMPVDKYGINNIKK